MEVVKYHNDINTLKMGSFTENETDIFFGILLKTKETEENTLTLNFTELKNLIDVKHRNNDRFIENVRSLNIKLKSLIQEVELPNGDFKVFSLFDDITTSPSRKEVDIEINKNFRYLIDNLISNYTVIDLKQLVSLKGNYPKILYRLLKQWESTNEYFVKIDNFRELMGIPSSYKMFNVRQKVFKPCMEQLEKYFEGLELEEIKTGRNVSSLKFTWTKKRIIKINPPAIKKKSGIGERELEEYKQQEQIEAINDNDVIKTLEITNDKYEELYLEYLKKHETTDDPLMRKTFDIANTHKYNIVD